MHEMKDQATEASITEQTHEAHSSKIGAPGRAGRPTRASSAKKRVSRRGRIRFYSKGPIRSRVPKGVILRALKRTVVHGRSPVTQEFSLSELNGELRKDQLVNEGYVRLLKQDSDGVPFKESDVRLFFDPPPASEILSDPIDRESFMRRAHSDPLVISQAKAWASLPKTPLTADTIFSGGTYDLKHSHLNTLFRQGCFEVDG
ncbi:MAG: hypothetical protein ACXWOH_07255, partial [Bdellovibrionota bacterium]